MLLLSGTGKVQTDKTGNKSKQLQLKSQILTEMYENIGTFPKISVIYDIHDPWDPWNCSYNNGEILEKI